MRYCFVLLLWSVIVTAPSFFERKAVVSFALSPEPRTKVTARCLADEAVATTIETLSMGQTTAEHLSAQSQLLAEAKKSPQCRVKVITTLMQAMDKSKLDLPNDRRSFFLWHYGAEVLASLKAEEGLDFLIAHLDLHDGTLFPLNHHPALVNVIRMGSIAIPKLAAVLQHSPDPNARQYAVFCLGEIGGPDAKMALQQALSSETNTCVSTFVQASLQAFNKSSSGYQVAPDDRTQWYSTFLCN